MSKKFENLFKYGYENRVFFFILNTDFDLFSLVPPLSV